MSAAPMLSVRDLVKDYPTGSGWLPGRGGSVRILDEVSFDLRAGETLGLVGESGSGKSTTGLILLRLLAASSGSVRFEGEELLALGERDFRPYRRKMQMIFQDPGGSLNPSMRVGAIIEETLQANRPDMDRAGRRAYVADLLDKVGLRAGAAQRYPHEFSGGQRQRLGIARALAVGPQLIVADEPVSALDVSVQAQVLNLMRDLQAELGLSYLFIAHDLAVVKQMSARVAVMYRGRIVENASSRDLYRAPAHPYTCLLLSAVPRADPRSAVTASATVAPLDRQPAGHGCAFAALCPVRVARCLEERPVLRTIAPEHHVACHLA